MKKSIFLSVLFLVQSTFASVCADPLKEDLCLNMRFLKSQVLALGEQRELMQVNYPYLGSIGTEINAITQVLGQSQWIDADHKEGIQTVQEKAQALTEQAGTADPLALATANGIQKKCAFCHSQTAPSSGAGWDQIFKNDWEQISKNCSKEGRTPYLCRSMNGMLSAYSGIFAASQLGRQNFRALQLSATEMARIAGDLKAKSLFHGSEFMIEEVQLKAQEVADLAAQGKVESFEKGLFITQTCMQCHGNVSFTSTQGLFQRLENRRAERNVGILRSYIESTKTLAQ